MECDGAACDQPAGLPQGPPRKRGRPKKEPQAQQQAAPAQPAAPVPPPLPPPLPKPKPPKSRYPLFAENGSVEKEVAALLDERLDLFVEEMEYHYKEQVVGGRMILKPISGAGTFDGFRATVTFYPPWYCHLGFAGAEY